MYKFTRWMPADCSGRVCWLLNELEVPYEAESLDWKIAKTDPEYLKRHPLGQVPAFTDTTTGLNLFESGAICLYLAEKHAEKNLLPAALRPTIYQWLMYNYATLSPVIEGYWQIDEKDPELQDKKALVDERVLKVLKPIEEALTKSEYIAGDQFTVADVPLGQMLFWLRNRPVFTELPKTKAYLERLKTRPAAIRSEMFQVTM